MSRSINHNALMLLVLFVSVSAGLVLMKLAQDHAGPASSGSPHSSGRAPRVVRDAELGVLSAGMDPLTPGAVTFGENERRVSLKIVFGDHQWSLAVDPDMTLSQLKRTIAVAGRNALGLGTTQFDRATATGSEYGSALSKLVKLDTTVVCDDDVHSPRCQDWVALVNDSTGTLEPMEASYTLVHASAPASADLDVPTMLGPLVGDSTLLREFGIASSSVLRVEMQAPSLPVHAPRPKRKRKKPRREADGADDYAGIWPPGTVWSAGTVKMTSV